MSGLGAVRRIEAVSFRSFPSASTHFDGTWAIRLTAGYGAKRINCVNPLDPADHSNLEERIVLAGARFARIGRPLTFRQSPLAAPELCDHLGKAGWSHFEESVVVAAAIGGIDLHQTVDHLPYRDAGHWSRAMLGMQGTTGNEAQILAGIIQKIEPEVGLFLLEDKGGEPVAAVRCVCDGELAGIFEMTTARHLRRRGFGRAILASALKWAAGRGAKTAWLQVTARNQAAIDLYSGFGFGEMYRYRYWQARP